MAGGRMSGPSERQAADRLALEWARLEHLKNIHDPDYIKEVQSKLSDIRLNEQKQRLQNEYDALPTMNVPLSDRTTYDPATGQTYRVSGGTRRMKLTPQMQNTMLAAEEERKNMQLKGQIDASLMETRYTAKDKASLIKIESQKQRGRRMLQSGQITADEYERFMKQKESEAMGVIPGQYPSLSPYPKGRGVGDYWDENGVTVSRKENGETWQVDERKTPRGLAAEQEARAIEAKAKIDAEDRKSKSAFMDKLMDKKVRDPKTGMERSLSASEMRELMEKRFPSTPMPSKEDVEGARQYWDQMVDRYGNNPPDNIKKAMMRAGEVIEAANKRAW
ncbi:MAG: hypothetical protein WC455_23145 [Dehalococcoidia bacterium]|jgi:hypothetical protein